MKAIAAAIVVFSGAVLSGAAIIALSNPLGFYSRGANIAAPSGAVLIAAGIVALLVEWLGSQTSSGGRDNQASLSDLQQHAMRDAKPPRRLMRFSVAGLLFVVLWIGVLLLGYRIGFHQGAAEWRKVRSERPQVKVYHVADLLNAEGADSAAAPPDFQSLIDAITATIASDEWDTVGGPASVQPVPSKRALAISAPPYVHDEVRQFLEQLRDEKVADAGSN